VGELYHAAVRQPETRRQYHKVLINTSWFRRQGSGWHLLAIWCSRKRITPYAANRWPLRHCLRRSSHGRLRGCSCAAVPPWVTPAVHRCTSVHSVYSPVVHRQSVHSVYSPVVHRRGTPTWYTGRTPTWYTGRTLPYSDRLETTGAGTDRLRHRPYTIAYTCTSATASVHSVLLLINLPWVKAPGALIVRYSQSVGRPWLTLDVPIAVHPWVTVANPWCTDSANPPWVTVASPPWVDVGCCRSWVIVAVAVRTPMRSDYK